MTLRISWLANGHVVHGYRKVFVIHDIRDNLRGVVVFAPMGYEAVYQVLESAQSRQDYQGLEIDPALLWGLSLLAQQRDSNENLFKDDGYEKHRPALLTTDDLLDGAVYQAAVKQGILVLRSE